MTWTDPVGADERNEPGEAAGKNAAGAGGVRAFPYFFSDQYDLGLEYVGHADGAGTVVVRGDLERREFIAFWHRDGRVTAAMNVNVWDVVEDLKGIVSSDQPIKTEWLRDPEVPLADLARVAGEPMGAA